MPQGNRYYIPGMIWHITHRCHKKEFLLKFARDRRRWQKWLYESKKRFGLCILNYTVTSNHIHLLVQDTCHRGTLPKSIQLIAGHTAQEYNIRNRRKGAFWEDRYHATAVQDGDHLIRCLVYIDLNIVRAGAVEHPSEWAFCGYNEIQVPPQRYTLIDRKQLMTVLGIDNSEGFGKIYKGWVDAALTRDNNVREDRWTQSIAVGGKDFVEMVKDRLGYKAIGRKVSGLDGDFELKENISPYRAGFQG
jgi:putative transposase